MVSKEAWGEDLTQDLVVWVSEAQTVNRAELRELADLYFARLATLVDERLAAAEVRLEAKLDQRIAGSEAKLEQRLHAVELGIAGLRVEVATQMRRPTGRSRQPDAADARPAQVDVRLLGRHHRAPGQLDGGAGEGLALATRPAAPHSDPPASL